MCLKRCQLLTTGGQHLFSIRILASLAGSQARHPLRCYLDSHTDRQPIGSAWRDAWEPAGERRNRDHGPRTRSDSGDTAGVPDSVTSSISHDSLLGSLHMHTCWPIRNAGARALAPACPISVQVHYKSTDCAGRPTRVLRRQRLTTRAALLQPLAARTARWHASDAGQRRGLGYWQHPVVDSWFQQSSRGAQAARAPPP